MKKYNLPIVTERLCIRPFIQEDFEKFKSLMEIPELTGWAMQKDQAKGFFNWHICNNEKMDVINGTVCFGLFDKVTDEILGNVGIGCHDDLKETEIFYALTVEVRGKGYGKEAVAAVSKWFFQNFDIPYLIGTVGVNNIPSQKILEKSGYQFINEQILKVHVLEESERFRYYRCFKPEEI